MTTSGTLTEFPVHTAASQPYGIAAGPDGNLWFTESSGNQIGRITTSGTVTEFTVPTPGGGLDGIAAGPDGNLWFTEGGANQIGRITTGGTVTEFAIPTAGSGARSIAAGPDGNLWFTEQAGGNVGRITTSGTVTEFPIPTAASFPRGIAAGPDGNLWFTEQDGNKIGRITSGVGPTACHESDGNGEFQDNQGQHHADFTVDKDSCEDQDADRIDSQDRGDGKDFHSTLIQSASFDDVSHSVTLVGLGVSGGNQVAFVVIAKEATATQPGWFSMNLTDGFTNAGYLLSGGITLH
jgi:hypothetical protein